MHILTFSSLYPNNIDSSHGIFVERRLRELICRTNIRSTVVAPVPWFPFRNRIFGPYAKLAAVSRRDRRFGIDIFHNRIPVIPRIGMNVAPTLMARASSGVVRHCVTRHNVALIDAHYFYPDGVAASILARELGIPYIITARGSDINLIAKFASPRKQMLEAAEHAYALVAVSHALAEEMRALGMPESKIQVLRNGVDLQLFSPKAASGARELHPTQSPSFVSVGSLKRAKGHHIAIDFIRRIPTAHLSIIGSGPEESALRNYASTVGVGERVEFTGTVTPEELGDRYRRADASILMSEREGMPNVVIESIACGTPVLATRVGGIPEVVDDPVCGELVESRDVDSLEVAWKKLVRRDIDADRIRELAARFSWTKTIDGLRQLMHDSAQHSS